MTYRPQTPLAPWAARIWVVGLGWSLLLSLACGWLTYVGLQPWALGLFIAIIGIGTTATAASFVRRAYDHQIRLQDEAESVRGRFRQWIDWLPKAEPRLSDMSQMLKGTTADDLPLTPESLTEFAMISDRVRAAAFRLQHEKAEANAVLANLDGGVIALDPEGRITLINDAAKRFFQIERPCVGHPLIQSIRQPEIIETVQKVARDRTTHQVNVEVRTDEGRRRALRVLCSSLRYGNVAGILIAAHDESETKHSEEVRREFVANVSHELKTPLAAIKGYAETVELALDDDPEAAKHFVSQIRDQCKRLERLIADMMTLARAQAGSHLLRPATLELDQIIAESMATYSPVAAAKHIQLTHEKSASSPAVVFADREATLTIANNLIGNAIRYTPEGGHVSASARSEANWGILTVKDDGIGIPENEQRRIFERFYRVDRSRKNSSGGTGLGLSIVKNLTQAQGGELQLTSQPGEGSEFEIRLPLPPRDPPLGLASNSSRGSTTTRKTETAKRTTRSS